MVASDEKALFAQRLAKALDAAKLPPRHKGRQQAVRRMFGVTQQAVGKWLAGEAMPKKERIIEIALGLGVRAEWLLSGRGSMYQDSPIAPTGQLGRVPSIGWVQAGGWCQGDNGFDGLDAEDWLHCPVNHGSRTFCLYVRGISMEPDFYEGDIIFVDPDVQAENKKFVIAYLEETREMTFKQYIVEGDRRYLKALNPAWPQPIVPLSDQAIICGVVIFSGKPR